MPVTIQRSKRYKEAAKKAVVNPLPIDQAIDAVKAFPPTKFDQSVELIFSLGITAIMNVPVRHAGRRLGTLNFCGEEGMYGEREMQIGRVLAGLLVPSLLRPSSDARELD